MNAATADVCRSGWLGGTAKSMTGRKQSSTEPTRYGTSLHKHAQHSADEHHFLAELNSRSHSGLHESSCTHTVRQ